MKILVVGRFYADGFALHIAETLEAMGHGIDRFEPGPALHHGKSRLAHRVGQARGIFHSLTDGVPRLRRRRTRALFEAAEKGRAEMCLVCHDFLWPEEVSQLKRLTGSPVAMWFPDALLNSGRAFFLNAPYDALFFKDPYMVRAFAGVAQAPVLYLPECFNPDRHQSAGGGADPRYACDITTAGNLHSYRVALFRHLKGYDVRLWGNPPPLWLPLGDVARMFQGRPIHDAEKAQAFLGAKIVLNNLHYSEISGLNVRTFEAAGVGAFQLVDWRPGLAQLFEDGKEIVSFRGLRDMMEKIEHWLPRDDERHRVAAAGQRRALAEHTYRHRLTILLDSVAGRAQGFGLPA